MKRSFQDGFEEPSNNSPTRNRDSRSKNQPPQSDVTGNGASPVKPMSKQRQADRDQSKSQ